MALERQIDIESISGGLLVATGLEQDCLTQLLFAYEDRGLAC